jgi:hypothetical protein
VADALNRHAGWNRVGLSNLGNVAISGGDAPFRLKGAHLYVHSFNIRTFGLIVHTVNGEMTFCWISDETFMSRRQVEALECAFIALLQDLISECHAGEVPSIATVAGARAGDPAIGKAVV